MQYRRAKIEGGTYFFTLVTHHRRKFLCEPENIELLRESFHYVMERHPFTIDAIAILPEHLHCILTLPDSDSDYSKRWRLIKSYFTRHCNQKYHGKMTFSRQNKKEQTLWQRRFWEHWIKNETDFINHVEYIHYNPVKHGLVQYPHEWPYSSFHRYVEKGVYQKDWGIKETIRFTDKIGYE